MTIRDPTGVHKFSVFKEKGYAKDIGREGLVEFLKKFFLIWIN